MSHLQTYPPAATSSESVSTAAIHPPISSEDPVPWHVVSNLKPPPPPPAELETPSSSQLKKPPPPPPESVQRDMDGTREIWSPRRCHQLQRKEGVILLLDPPRNRRCLQAQAEKPKHQKRQKRDPTQGEDTPFTDGTFLKLHESMAKFVN